MDRVSPFPGFFSAPKSTSSPMGRAEAASSESSSVSSTLLDQLRSGRPEAWERLVRLYSPVIYRWCRRSGLAAEDAADVLQEVLSAVMLHLPDFHRHRPEDSFSGWLAAITRNKVRDHLPPAARQGRGPGRQHGTAAVGRGPSAAGAVGRVHPAGRRVGGMALAGCAGDDPGGIRAAHVASVLADHGRWTGAGPRRNGLGDERCCRLHGQITGPPPAPAGHGRAAAVGGR